MKPIIEKELYKIADILLSYRTTGENLSYWEGLEMTDGKFGYPLIYSTWNGTSGIIIFFLALYRYKKEREFLHVAEDAAKSLVELSQTHPPEYHNLYSGSGSMIYMLLDVYETTQNDYYLDQAVNLAVLYDQPLRNTVEYDLLCGTAGVLLVLTKLYHYSQDARIMESIHFLINKLVLNARPSQQGFSWGENTISMDGLCGFSHGASGIAYVLMQVGNYFHDEELIWLAEQGLLYEMQYYVPEKASWMDLRTPTSGIDPNTPNIMNWDKALFTQYSNDYNTWAHGAVGCAISRLYAYEITGKEIYRSLVDAVIQRCIYDVDNHQKKNFILFSGYGGIADILLYAGRVLQRQDLETVITTIAKRTINRDHRQWGVNKKNDMGLLTGSSGIGYMYLQILQNTASSDYSKQQDSILYPRLPENSSQKTFHVKELLFKRFFPGHPFPVENAWDVFPSTIDGDNISNDKFSLLRNSKGKLSFNTRISILEQRLKEYDDARLCELSLTLTPFVKITYSADNWYILYCVNDRIHQFDMSPGMHLLIQELLSGKSINNIESTDKQGLLIAVRMMLSRFILMEKTA
jgi:hypothetical protein